ncbi:hypothetical protein MLD38_032792 [Melastoma candidum]|uniref:Uncharacterized protein n=1 Tax=Melastoma candidum TaxID=119954 RepID=A0ACB9M6Y4_9MYRT|nr:hypothetical protein MLD38_032792 [Melastoma candidum]
MVQKRSFDDQASHESPLKLRRQEQFCNQPVLFPGYDFYEESMIPVNSSVKPEDFSLPRVVGKDEMFYEHGRTILSHSHDNYGWLLRNLPQKVVPIGPEYQAEIPAWSPPDNPVVISKSLKTAPYFVSVNATEERVTPMSGLGVCRIDSDQVGAGRSDCGCRDEGSLRCVRQHIVEAREKLRMTVGEDAFLEWSCHDMGEQVADRWLDEEEVLFQEVVFSCPYSTGKNFWNYLSSAFPSRLKAEIVSYYYNVFVLQRRARQNRSAHLNVDSDDDEWHSSDDEDEDSDVEYPEGEGGPISSNGLVEMNESDGYIEEETSSDEADTSEISPPKLIGKDDGTQDDSCMSFESVVALTETRFKDNDVNPWLDADVQNYISEPGDVKFWDAGVLSYPSREVDFLPTVSMIEEVFADEPWNFNQDPNGLS